MFVTATLAAILAAMAFALLTEAGRDLLRSLARVIWRNRGFTLLVAALAWLALASQTQAADSQKLQVLDLDAPRALRSKPSVRLS